MSWLYFSYVICKAPWAADVPVRCSIKLQCVSFVVISSSEILGCGAADQYWGSELTQWKAIFINNEQSTLSPCPVCHSWARREQKYKHMYLAYILPDTASVLVTALHVGTLACFLVPGWWCYTFWYRLSLMIADKAFCVWSVSFLSWWAVCFWIDGNPVIEESYAIESQWAVLCSIIPINSPEMCQWALITALSASSFLFAATFHVRHSSYLVTAVHQMWCTSLNKQMEQFLHFCSIPTKWD